MHSSTIVITDTITMAHDTKADPPPQLIETQAAQLPPRRSSRLASRLAGSPQQAADVSATMSEPSRNPKRKASEAANHVTAPPDKLLDEALAPLTSKDVQEWEGWIELESEPVRKPVVSALCGLCLTSSGILQYYTTRSRRQACQSSGDLYHRPGFS